MTEATVTLTVKEIMSDMRLEFNKIHTKLDAIAKKGNAADNRSKNNKKLIFSLGFITFSLFIFIVKELMQHLASSI